MRNHFIDNLPDDNDSLSTEAMRESVKIVGETVIVLFAIHLFKPLIKHVAETGYDNVGRLNTAVERLSDLSGVPSPLIWTGALTLIMLEVGVLNICRDRGQRRQPRHGEIGFFRQPPNAEAEVNEITSQTPRP